MFSILVKFGNWLSSLIPDVIKDWYYDVLKKHYIWQPNVFFWVIAFLVAYRMTSPFLWIFFKANIVDGVLSELCFQPLSLFSLLLFFGMLLWLASCLKKSVLKNGYKTRLFNCFILGFVVVEYWLNRGDYIQYPLYSARLFKYTIGLSDPIALFITILSIALTINLFRHGKYDAVANIFAEDLPIEEIANDGFFRTDYFTHIQNTVRDIKFDSTKAFSIGLNSSWGYGKTSLLIILRKLFEGTPDTIYMDYNPWMSSSKSGLTLDFFVQLEDTLSSHIETDNLIIRYGKALAKIDVGQNPLKTVGKLFESETSLKERHDSVSSLIQKTNKRFVVIIDDLDRLDNQEVFEVLRLIRNTANFSRMIFVVAYDKGYLLNALQKNNVYAPEKYLEKIFNLEMLLPYIEKSNLSKMLIKAFETGLNTFGIVQNELTQILDQFKLLTNATTSSSDLKFKAVNELIWSILKNKRDVIRFSNSLLLIYRSNYKYTYLPDLILLEIIKFLDIKNYEEIGHEGEYLTSVTDSSGKVYYELFSSTPIAHSTTATTPIPARVLGDIGSYDLRIGKTMQFKTIVEALFEQPSMGDFNHDKAMLMVNNFEDYFIFAKKNVPTGGLAAALNLGRTR